MEKKSEFVKKWNERYLDPVVVEAVNRWLEWVEYISHPAHRVRPGDNEEKALRALQKFWTETGRVQAIIEEYGEEELSRDIGRLAREVSARFWTEAKKIMARRWSG